MKTWRRAWFTEQSRNWTIWDWEQGIVFSSVKCVTHETSKWKSSDADDTMFTGDSDLQSMLGGMSQQQLMQLLGKFGQFSHEMMNWECTVSYLVITDVVVDSDKRINYIAEFLIRMWLAVSKYAGICTSVCMRAHRDMLARTNAYIYICTITWKQTPTHTHTQTLTHSLTPSVTQAHMLTCSLTFTLTQSPGLVNCQ